MSYFLQFPIRHKYPVTLVNENNTDQVTFNLSFPDFYRHVALAYPKVNDGKFFYERVTLLDGERPEQLSHRLYGTENYYWTFFIINDHLRLGEALQWPLSFQSLRKKLEIDFSGLTITTYKSRFVRKLKPYIAFQKDNYIFNKFQIGETIVGQQSGIAGVIYNIRPEFGQIQVKDVVTINDMAPAGEREFRDGELILGYTEYYGVNDPRNVLSGSSVICHFSLLTQHAIFKYIEPSTGRDINNKNFIMIDYTNSTSGIESITYKEYYELMNERLSNMRVLKKDSIRQFVENYRSLIRKQSRTIE